MTTASADNHPHAGAGHALDLVLHLHAGVIVEHTDAKAKRAPSLMQWLKKIARIL